MARWMRLARVRKTAGFTQESLAEALEVDRATVARWEAGHHEPWPYIRPKMARLLKVSSEKLDDLPQSTPSVQIDPSQAGLLLPGVIDGHPADPATALD